ncbi:MAG: SRPBCC domain-containing protein [Bacteroidota bacterium]
MEKQPYVIERIYNAPVAIVWKAISNKEDMKKWYFDLAEFKPEVGFEFRFNGGPDGKVYVHICRITEVIKNKRIAYSWRYEGYEGNSLVTFELFEEGNKTRLRLTHAGIETFPASNPDLAKENFAMGWNEIIGTSLKNYVEKTDPS